MPTDGSSYSSTALGRVTCLFATRGTDFRALLRGGASDEELWNLLSQTWSTRHDRYSEERFEEGAKARGKVEMSCIGG